MTKLVHLPVFDTIAMISKLWNLSSLSSWSRLEVRPTPWPLRWTEAEDPNHGTKSRTLKCKCKVEAAKASKIILAKLLKFAWLPMSANTLDNEPNDTKMDAQRFTKNGMELGDLVRSNPVAEEDPAPSCANFTLFSPGAGG